MYVCVGGGAGWSRRILKSKRAAKYQPGYDGLPESGKKMPPCMAECANGCAIRSGDAS